MDWARDLAHDLHPSEIEDLGLAEALRGYCAERAATSDAQLRCSVDGDLRCPARRVAINVYRIAQEAITNALRHANADRIDVVLGASAQGLTLTVTDDGRGLPRHGRGHRPVEGIGMVGMRERASMLGAGLRVSSEPGAGTCVHLEVPADGTEAAE